MDFMGDILIQALVHEFTEPTGLVRRRYLSSDFGLTPRDDQDASY